MRHYLLRKNTDPALLGPCSQSDCRDGWGEVGGGMYKHVHTFKINEHALKIDENQMKTNKSQLESNENPLQPMKILALALLHMLDC